MAPDVLLLPAGGTDDGGIGTSFDLVGAAIDAAFAGGRAGVALLTDLGSADLTADSVLELLADDRIAHAPGPLVEGSVAGAVSAQTGATLEAVVAAVGQAGQATRAGSANSVPDTARPADAAQATDATGASHPAASHPADSALATVVVPNAQGLHARPAGLLARTASSFDAKVSLNGVDAASVLAVMGLGVTSGAEVSVRASGPQASEAVAAVVQQIESGFGES